MGCPRHSCHINCLRSEKPQELHKKIMSVTFLSVRCGQLFFIDIAYHVSVVSEATTLPVGTKRTLRLSATHEKRLWKQFWEWSVAICWYSGDLLFSQLWLHLRLPSGSRLPCSVCWQSRRWEPLICGGHTNSGIPDLVRTDSGIPESVRTDSGIPHLVSNKPGLPWRGVFQIRTLVIWGFDHQYCIHECETISVSNPIPTQCD